jgi:hypothetical protein
LRGRRRHGLQLPCRGRRSWLVRRGARDEARSILLILEL